MSAAPRSIELSPAILKLQHLRLVAAHKLGESLGLSRYVDSLKDARAALVREQLELERHQAPNRLVYEHTRHRIESIGVRLVYVDAEITAANQLLQQVSASAGSARTSADKLAEHLRQDLAAMGIR